MRKVVDGKEEYNQKFKPLLRIFSVAAVGLDILRNFSFLLVFVQTAAKTVIVTKG